MLRKGERCLDIPPEPSFGGEGAVGGLVTVVALLLHGPGSDRYTVEGPYLVTNEMAGPAVASTCYSAGTQRALRVNDES